jgi:opacity protein-like surface antigen
MRRWIVCSWCAIALALPASALAQDTGQSAPGQSSSQKPPQTAKPKTGKLPIGLRAMGVVQLTAMDSSATFKTLVGTSNLPGFGGAVDILNLVSKVFVRFGVSQDSKDGSRVIVMEDGTVHSTGVPLTLSVRTVELAAGWRKYPKKHPKFAWYLGAGIAFTELTSESPFPQPGDNDSDSGSGALVFAGFDRTIWKSIIGGLEVQYRSIQDAIGSGGVSEAKGENSLGGATIRGMIGIRLRR